MGFQALHGDTALVSSIDVPMFTPGSVRSAPKDPFTSAHVDQNSHDTRGDLANIEEYQGILYAWPCSPEDDSTATVVWPRSYRKGDRSCPYSKMMEDEYSKMLGSAGIHYTQLTGTGLRTQSAL